LSYGFYGGVCFMRDLDEHRLQCCILEDTPERSHTLQFADLLWMR
jgi:hypothetical protein